MSRLFPPPRPTTTTTTTTTAAAAATKASTALPPLLILVPRRRSRKIVCRSLGDGWKVKLPNIDREEVMKRLNSWVGKTRGVLDEVTAPMMKTRKGKGKNLNENDSGDMRIEEAFVVETEPTVDRLTPNGALSLAAVVSIEQFARMSGLTGSRVQKIFRTLAKKDMQDDGRCLVEYCCFRYLSKGTSGSDIHPSLKEPAFQRLIFISMLAWQQPYSKDGDLDSSHQDSSLQGRHVGEEAFVRFAPAIAGLADRPTAHHLFRELAGDERGISLKLWTAYIGELVKVYQSRKSFKIQNGSRISTERLMCLGSSRKRPVLKWDGNSAWPGVLTLTDRALYFEKIDLRGPKQSFRLDLTECGSHVKKEKVGPFGSKLFDSAVAVSSGHEKETWVLEFVDFGGETRRDVWYAFIKEIISLHDFIREYGPKDEDSSIWEVYGSDKGLSGAIGSAANSIARLQSLQLITKLSEDPSKLMQFSYLRTVPNGDIVLQTLALNLWGGPSIKKPKQEESKSSHLVKASDNRSPLVIDVDGSVYLHKWMRSSSWTSGSSENFWKYMPEKKGIVLSKDLVVGDLNLVERAALLCKQKSQIVEKTQASIDAAMIKGIPSNIDLSKELLLPLVIAGENFEKLRRWEDPRSTLLFLVGAYTIILRNLVALVLPVCLVTLALTMLLLKNLREQGRLGRFFGRVTIRDQAPSNTIQKIVAVKEAMADLEASLQNLNVTLLKIRTIILSGQPEITNKVAFCLLGASVALLAVPLKFILSFFLLDLFTRELEFRRETVKKFMEFLREQWASVHAAPVAVLPYEAPEATNGSAKIIPNKSDGSEQKTEKTQTKKNQI